MRIRAAKDFHLEKKIMNLSTKRGCLLATDRTDCTSTWGFKQFPKDTSLSVVGNLIEEPNAPPKSYGFTGCYKKTELNILRP